MNFTIWRKSDLKSQIRDSPMISESISSINSSPRTSNRIVTIPNIGKWLILIGNFLSLNLDADLSDPLLASEYAQDIDQHLREAEMRTRPKPHYMRKQNDLTAQMRTILIDWLVEVSKKLENKFRRTTPNLF